MKSRKHRYKMYDHCSAEHDEMRERYSPAHLYSSSVAREVGLEETHSPSALVCYSSAGRIRRMINASGASAIIMYTTT